MDGSPVQVLITLALLLAIHFTAMADFYHKDKPLFIFNSIDNSIVSHTDTVEMIGAAELFRPMRSRRNGKGVDF